MALEARQAEAFGHHALAREGRIAMDEERHNLRALDHVAQLVLLGARLAEHHRIGNFQMGGIGDEGQMYAVAVELAVRGRAQMILHIARTIDGVGGEGAALEFVEDGAVRLAHDLGQHIEAAAMGHAQHDLLHAQRAAALDDLLQRRDHGLAAIKAEALCAGETQVAETLEAFGLHELGENGALALAGEGDGLVRSLDALLHPGLLDGVGHMHEFEGDGVAIGAVQDRQHLGDGGEFQTQHMIDEDLAIIILGREAVARRMQLLVILAGLHAQRVELGLKMAAHAEGADHHEGAHAVAGGALDVGGGDLGALGLTLGLQLVANDLLHIAPIAIEGGDRVIARRHRPVGLFPGGALRIARDGGRIVLQGCKEFAPGGVYARRVLLVARMEFLDIGRVRAIEEGSLKQRLVEVLSRHFTPLSWIHPVEVATLRPRRDPRDEPGGLWLQ